MPLPVYDAGGGQSRSWASSAGPGSISRLRSTGRYLPRASSPGHSTRRSCRARLRGDQVAAAVLAVDIVTRPGVSHRRLSALAADHVGELVIIALESHTIDWLALVASEYEPIESSRSIDCSPASLADVIEWPTPDGRA